MIGAGLRFALVLLCVAALAVRAQQRSISSDWIENLREERTTIVALLDVRGVLFVPNLLGMPVPVAHENLKMALLLARLDPSSRLNAEDAMRALLQFDRGYRDKLSARLGEIDRELQAAGAPVPATPSRPAAPVSPVAGSLFGSNAPPRGSSFDQYVEDTQRSTVPAPPAGQALQIGPSGSTLLGQPLCTYTVELIITAGTEILDRDPTSQTYGRMVLSVPAAAESGFHVQLHRAGRTVRLSGRDARRALEEKGYLTDTGNGWRGTPAYENFVSYGAGDRRGVATCPGASPPVTAGALRVSASGSVTRGGAKWVSIGATWTIDNPSPVPIRFTKMTRTHWVMKRDGGGTVIGGTWVTDTQRGFTLPAGRSTRTGQFFLPSSGRGNAGGTYREVYEGTDADGRPVRLVLEFNGAEAHWPP